MTVRMISRQTTTTICTETPRDFHRHGRIPSALHRTRLASRFCHQALADAAEGSAACFTSNFVLDETITLLARRSTYQFAAERARNLFKSTSLLILRSDENAEVAALELFQKYADQSVSFTDCVSFVLMEKQNIKCAFSFDRHFAIAGFEVEP